MDAFIGEIKAFPFGYAPQGWLPCDGTEYNIQQYQVLYSIIGTLYGSSNPRQSFKVPNLQGRVPVGASLSSNPIGLTGGTESIVLSSLNQIPAHNHTFKCLQVTDTSQMTNKPTPGASYLASAYSQSAAKGVFAYSNFKKDGITLHPATLSYLGGQVSNPNIVLGHENRMPYLSIYYCICYSSDYYPYRP